MENLNNNNQNNFNNNQEGNQQSFNTNQQPQFQPQPNQQQSHFNQPQSSTETDSKTMPEMEATPAASEFNPVEPPQKSGWGSWLALLIVVVLSLYFTDAWNWLGGADDNNDNKQVEEVGNIKEDGEEDVSEKKLSDNKDIVQLPADANIEKGHITFSISAGVPSGTSLSNVSRSDVEMRKVYVFNPYKKDWVLIYDGVRPLSLKDLSVSGDKHDLISFDILALNYEKIKLEFTDILSVDGQKITRDRVAELPGFRVEKNEKNTVNIFFNISDLSMPIPLLK